MSRMVRQEFFAELKGEVNGQPIHVDGQGSILRELGITSGTYLVRKLPDEFDPKLLAACLITGYPSACATAADKVNPFGLRNYQYTRQLDFSNGGRLELTMQCTQTADKLLSYFTLQGEVRALNIGNPKPILESWQRADGRTIRGEFIIDWGDDSDAGLRVAAASYYAIQDMADIAVDSERFIEVTPRMLNSEVLSLFQVSHLT